VKKPEEMANLILRKEDVVTRQTTLFNKKNAAKTRVDNETDGLIIIN
jgi:hypothetical protein